MRQLLFRVRRMNYGEGAEICMAVRSPDGTIGFVQPMQVVMRTPEDAVYEEPAAIRVDNLGELQPLMNQLWEIGIRPTDIGSPGHLAATQAHLNDMRKLVEKTLEVKL